eukprot:365910-Chlamydomonas_euryale.AAC.31
MVHQTTLLSTNHQASEQNAHALPPQQPTGARLATVALVGSPADDRLNVANCRLPKMPQHFQWSPADDRIEVAAC